MGQKIYACRRSYGALLLAQRQPGVMLLLLYDLAGAPLLVQLQQQYVWFADT